MRRDAIFLTVNLLLSFPVWAADTTPPARPIVSDEGLYTTSLSQLHASWSSADPESGIVEHQYLIRRDSRYGTTLIPWSSSGTATSVIQHELKLLQGRTYYFWVKAKNGAGLWSSTGYSDGIRVDTTAPSAPGRPTKGRSSTDDDDDAERKRRVSWRAASDSESRIAAYELQERRESAAPWMTLTSDTASRNFLVSGPPPHTTAFYRVRAKNHAGLWGAWSPVSEGIRTDRRLTHRKRFFIGAPTSTHAGLFRSIADTIPPTGVVSMNGGSPYTTSRIVTLTLAAADDSGTVVQMQFSNDRRRYTVPEAYAPIKRWSLPPGEGQHTVYVRFRDQGGNWSEAASDTITLDAVAPRVVIVYPTHGMLLGSS